MFQISADFLALSSEAAILVQRGKLSYANAAACKLLGEDCVGKSVQSVFDAEIAEAQASSFIGEAAVQGKRYILRSAKSDGVEAIFLSRPEIRPDLLSDAFVYSIRSALMNMGVSVEMARLKAEELEDAALLSQIAAMNQSYLRLSRLVSNVSVIRKTIEGGLYTNLQQFDLSQMAERLTESLKLLFPQPELRVTSSGEMRVTADMQLMEQLFSNLISNCVVHAHGCTRVSINLLDCGDRVMISVDDDGCGIPPEELYTVFDRYRHGFSISDIGGGAGLGLSVVRTVAQFHGGTMLLESRLGKGTVVRVSVLKGSSYPKLRSEQTEYQPKMSRIQTNMADCLPISRFSERFSD